MPPTGRNAKMTPGRVGTVQVAHAIRRQEWSIGHFRVKYVDFVIF